MIICGHCGNTTAPGEKPSRVTTATHFVADDTSRGPLKQIKEERLVHARCALTAFIGAKMQEEGR